MAVGPAACPGHCRSGDQALPPEHHSYFRDTRWEMSFVICKDKLSAGSSEEHWPAVMAEAEGASASLSV